MRVKLDDFAIAPTRAHATDAGLDLYTPRTVMLAPRSSADIDTGVHIELPPCTFGKLESKSGLNMKYGIVSCGGVIDEGYSGSILVKLYNMTDYNVTLPAGSKVVQLIVQPCLYESVELVNEVSGGERGEDGFGSTGW